MRILTRDRLDEVVFREGADGRALVPVVAQDAANGAVLMVAFADREALEKTLETGLMHYWSRSRGRGWQKGEESGHVQHVERLAFDCDADTVLATVRQEGPACHTGAATCFQAEGDVTRVPAGVLGALAMVLRDRHQHPKEGSHTNRLLDDENLRLKKVSEEAGEFVVAAARHDRDGMVYEAADVLYHVLVALESEGIDADDVLGALAARRK